MSLTQRNVNGLFNNIKNNLLALKINDYYELSMPSIVFAIVGFLTVIIASIEKTKFINLNIQGFLLQKEHLDLLVGLGVGYVVVSTLVLNIICKIGYPNVAWFLTTLALIFFVGLILSLYVFKVDFVKTIQEVSSNNLPNKKSNDKKV
jgi:hypothetical protein